MSDIESLQHLVNFGAAGLMGLLWTWERAMSRQRERQLTEAHDRIKEDRARVAVLTNLIERNTRAVIRFEETQSALCRLLERALEREGGGRVDILHELGRRQNDASNEAP